MTLQEMLEDYDRQSNPSRFGITSLSQAASPMSFQFEDATNLYSPEMMAAKRRMSIPGKEYPLGLGMEDPAFFGDFIRGYAFDPYKGTRGETFNYLYGTRPGFQYDTSGILDSTPKQNFEFLSSAYEDDDEEQVDYIGQEPKGIGKLFQLLQSLPTPMNMLRSGLDSLRGFNQRLRNNNFARSQTLAEYFDRTARAKNAARMSERFEDFSERTSG